MTAELALKTEIQKKESEVESIDHQISNIKNNDIIHHKEIEVRNIDKKIVKLNELKQQKGKTYNNTKLLGDDAEPIVYIQEDVKNIGTSGPEQKTMFGKFTGFFSSMFEKVRSLFR